MADVIGAGDVLSPNVDAIRTKYSHYESVKPNTCVSDIRVLLKEIDRLEKDFDDCYNGNL